ncbi:Protein of unknown function [Gryllus bimaculatus]|nr:Protein of unknown function [Gryllus bimaculatus]
MRPRAAAGRRWGGAVAARGRASVEAARWRRRRPASPEDGDGGAHGGRAGALANPEGDGRRRHWLGGLRRADIRAPRRPPAAPRAAQSDVLDDQTPKRFCPVCQLIATQQKGVVLVSRDNSSVGKEIRLVAVAGLLKYMPVTSVDVERSSSTLKLILSPKHRKLEIAIHEKLLRNDCLSVGILLRCLKKIAVFENGGPKGARSAHEMAVATRAWYCRRSLDGARVLCGVDGRAAWRQLHRLRRRWRGKRTDDVGAAQGGGVGGSGQAGKASEPSFGQSDQCSGLKHPPTHAGTTQRRRRRRRQ